MARELRRAVLRIADHGLEVTVLDPPFEIVSCSWPRPVVREDGRWVSEPEWDAPHMPAHPRPAWRMIHGEPCWTIDWREHFSAGLRNWHSWPSGEMRGFHVVFALRVLGTGTLAFWDDDGSVVRRNGEVVHDDRSAHGVRRSAVDVRAGDRVVVAQWQEFGEWLWGARLMRPAERVLPADEFLLTRLGEVRARLRRPTGPPLRMYTNALAPARVATAIYSMILHGYSPSRVLLFGEKQWTAEARAVLRKTLPFADVVGADAVQLRLHEIGGTSLVRLADEAWYAMKACIALFCRPAEFCQMDDDVFVLGSVADALEQFRRHDLVYSSEPDQSDVYCGWQRAFETPWPLSTGRFNAGLFWCRQLPDARKLAARAMTTRPAEWRDFHWEQGFIAAAYARSATYALPPQRYFFPLFDGLPGGILEYDYARNPCRFASVHFGGLTRKPTDEWMPYLAPAVLGPPDSSGAPGDGAGAVGGDRWVEAAEAAVGS